MKMSEVVSYVNETIALRKPNDHKVAEYAERMAAGVKFPAIVIGRWPKSEKYGEAGIVDGMHRVSAAAAANLKELEVEEKKFNTLEDMLAYMYTVNMSHGLPVTEGQRNARIKLIKQIDPKLTLEKIAKQFGLHPSSVDRILKGSQGEGKSGPKGKGANKSAGQKSQGPKKVQAMFKTIENLNVEFSRKRPNQLAELGAYLSPSTEKNPDGELDEDKYQEIVVLHNYLGGLIKELK